MSTTTKKVSDSATETLHIVRPNHLNAAGRLFGGVLMQWIDELAGLVAKRHYAYECDHGLGRII